MSISQHHQKQIQVLKERYERLRKGKDSLLCLIDEAELSENVYNSNAIENSTLTLKETEKILLEMEVSRNVSLREVFEAKNLARVVEYIREKSARADLNTDLILLLHKMLISTIDDFIAGRFRQEGEFVRVGTYIAPPPEKVEQMIENAIIVYNSSFDQYFLERIARFHLEFEHIHPFLDGNGRIGRVLMNYELQRLGFPSVIIRNKGKNEYYQAFLEYDDKKSTKKMENILVLALMESLHKRLAYLEGMKIIRVTEYAKQVGKSMPTLLNAARRQTIPAFREKGVWKIGI